MPEPPQLPPIATAPLSLVLPARNEEAYLEATLQSWTAYLATLQRDYEILLVDDGSTDQTAAITEALAAQNSRIRLLRQATPCGLGAAVRAGLGAAQYPLILCSVCGDQYEPADLGKLLEVIDQVDLVSGYRVWPPGGSRGGFSERAYRWLVRWLFGVRLSDVNCAFRLFRRHIFARILLQSNGPFVQAEILAKANFLGCLLTEVPVHYRPASGADATKWKVPAKQTRGEMRRVFYHPDFGPAQLPAEPKVAPETTPPQAAPTEPAPPNG
jgi:glycosyltransferase involved in cell wall biosynthesis